MPYTANRAFKQDPRIVERAEGCHYYTPEGRKVFDGLSGPCGVAAPAHSHPGIAEAVAKQLRRMEYAPCLPVRPRLEFRAGESNCRTDAAGPLPRILYQLRIGEHRYFAENSPGLLA